MKNNQQATISVKDYGTETSGNPDMALNVLTSSEFLLGGVPPNSEAQTFIVNNKLSIPLAGLIQIFYFHWYQYFKLTVNQMFNVFIPGPTFIKLLKQYADFSLC